MVNFTTNSVSMLLLLASSGIGVVVNQVLISPKYCVKKLDRFTVFFLFIKRLRFYESINKGYVKLALDEPGDFWSLSELPLALRFAPLFPDNRSQQHRPHLLHQKWAFETIRLVRVCWFEKIFSVLQRSNV